MFGLQRDHVAARHCFKCHVIFLKTQLQTCRVPPGGLGGLKDGLITLAPI